MSSVLDVLPGDSFKLLSSPIVTIPIPVSQLMALTIPAETAIMRYQSKLIGNGLYTSHTAVHPTYNVTSCLFFNKQDTGYATPIDIADLPSIEDSLVVIDILEQQLYTVEYKGIPWQIEPHPLSIITEIAEQVLQSHFHSTRPWMKGIIPYPNTLHLEEEIETTIIDTLLYNTSTTLYSTLDQYPTRLIKISKEVYGLAVNILCDVRVYLWTKEMENAYVSLHN